MAKKIVLFNNKGGVGKTTFLFHLGYAMEKLDKKILFVDLDPQCNLSSYICTDKEIENVWDEKNGIYDAVEPLIKGIGDIKEIFPYQIDDRNISLIVGDLRLGEYEERLSTAWTESMAGTEIGFRMTSAIFRIIESLANSNDIDYVLIDVGPNLGSLNRAVLLSCDYFFVPLVPDLFSFRGLENIGITFKRWVENWGLAKKRFTDEKSVSFNIQKGRPAFAGYINQQFNIYRGKETLAWQFWTKKVSHTIKEKLTKKLRELGDDMVIDINTGTYKLGDFKNYHSLMPKSQENRKPVFELTSREIVGIHIQKAKDCGNDFNKLARKILKL